MTERNGVIGNGMVVRLLACAVALAAATAASRVGAVVVTVSSPDGAPGEPLEVTVGLQRAEGDPTVTGAQTDVLFNTTQIELVGACADDQSACRGDADCGGTCADDQSACRENADCGKDGQGNDINCSLLNCNLPCTNAPQVNAGDFVADLPDTIRPPDEPPMDRLRVAVFAFANPAATYDTGPLVTCTFQIKSDAAAGQIEASTDRTQASDPATELIPGVTTDVRMGNICDGICPTVTPTATLTPELPTATPTEAGPTSTPVPTDTPRPTNTPTARPTNTAVPSPTSTATSSVPRVSGRDNDGCAIAPHGSAGGTGVLWCLVPVLAALRRRHRRV